MQTLCTATRLEEPVWLKCSEGQMPARNSSLLVYSVKSVSLGSIDGMRCHGRWEAVPVPVADCEEVPIPSPSAMSEHQKLLTGSTPFQGYHQLECSTKMMHSHGKLTSQGVVSELFPGTFNHRIVLFPRKHLRSTQLRYQCVLVSNNGRDLQPPKGFECPHR